MNRFFRKIIAYVLLGAFSIILAPEHLLHEFVAHEDTIECGHTNELTLSEKHTHCEILQLQAQVYTEPESLSLPVVPFQQQVLFAYPAEHYFSADYFYSFLRGPPTAG